MEHVFTWILVLTVLLCLSLFAVLAEAPASDFAWETNDVVGMAITDYAGNGGEVVIPAQINGQPVTKIDDFAFGACSNLISVTISNSVTSIAAQRDGQCVIRVDCHGGRQSHQGHAQCCTRGAKWESSERNCIFFRTPSKESLSPIMMRVRLLAVTGKNDGFIYDFLFPPNNKSGSPL